MNYRDYNDYELVDLVAESNEEAEKIMFEKYRPLVISKANKYYGMVKNKGVEMSDLVQEAYIGFSQALKDYRDNKDAQFRTFATICIERELQSFVKGLNRQKHQILNDSVVKDVLEPEKRYIEFITDEDSNPINFVIDKELEVTLEEIINEKLTDYERQIYRLRIAEFSYQEIAKLLDTNAKSIDNSLQRIKDKIRKELRMYNK
jgi:RNA polymerase sporulation-specific sigma factor